ncbi:palmitoyltransferase pfa5 [Aspergillus sclerotialis]|uniref:Palmitoyltransferase n=1 Tax=Aspergillus sclerotialis TaxID=2070753 RepID=A0A3A2Z6F0_9EURO|nr:palmitoyltransferase pfa5 [Aspergillus sclerotialis]
MARSPTKRVNVAVSRIIPPILLGVVIYASYVVTKPLCIDYLFYPKQYYNRSPQVGAGVAILVIYYILLIFLIATYLRLLYNVVWDPGYLPRGAQCLQAQEEGHAKGHRRRRHRRKGGRKGTKETEKADGSELDLERGLEYDIGGMAFPLDNAGLESFYTKDVFVCQPDGRPPYCSSCCQFKTDRTHHCREVERCVRKMDHYCPWVGGVVSETSFKFFIQFVFYTAVYCIFALIVTAYYTAQLKRSTGRINAHWAVGIGLSAFFGIFSFSMTISAVQLSSQNLTTIENLSRRSAVWTLAIRIPEHLLSKLNPDSESSWAPTFATISYPLTPTPPSQETQNKPSPSNQRHVFAILQTQPGENPFDLGSWTKNLQQVMGFSVAEWLLPFKQSPCANHSSLESAFALGPVVDRLKRDAGLEPGPMPEEDSSKREGHERKKRRKHRRHRRS